MRAAAPDGYTVIVPNDSVLTMVPNMKSDAGYDPFADFMPVTQLVGIPLGLIAHPSFEANNVAELIALAKKTPGGINYSSGGPGSPQHVGMELFVRADRHPDDACAASRRDRGGDGDRLRQRAVGITGMSAVFPLLADKRVEAARRDDGAAPAAASRCAGDLRDRCRVSASTPGARSWCRPRRRPRSWPSSTPRPMPR